MEGQLCPYCGRENLPFASKCTHCGRLLDCFPTVAVLDFFSAVQAALSHKYELVAEIGKGGNAAVYQAIQKNLDRKVALKVLLPQLICDHDFLGRFQHEARAIGKLRHPHIVTVHDVGSENGVHYMAMEFLEGKDLHHLVQERGRLSVKEAIAMARCIASALDYAHNYGIVHRDVKSSNIIMTSGRTAVLTDFGIAQDGYSSVHTRVGIVLGTPEFMSPEQAGGKAVDSRSDIYSLGVVLYHTLSGRLPFKGKDPISTFHKILYEDPVPIGNLVTLPISIERAINRCLEKDPAKRIATGKELINLLTLKSSQIPVASSVSPRSKTRKSGRALMNLAFSLIVACVLVTGYFTWERFAVANVSSRRASVVTAPAPALREVPRVVGMTEEQAINTLQRSGFQAGRVGVVAVAEPAVSGRVESQRPAQGATAKPGSTVHLLVAASLSREENFGRIGEPPPIRSNGIAVSYKAIKVDPFDGFAPPISLGILDFTGPEGKPTDLSAKFYEALSTANRSFRIFPCSTLEAEQKGLGLASFDPSSKEVLNALGRELSVDFVITGAATNEVDSSFTMQMIKCTSGIRVFSLQFRNSSSSCALDDAVLFLLNRQVPVYSNQ
jgi:serine/threonine protein kinase